MLNWTSLTVLYFAPVKQFEERKLHVKQVNSIYSELVPVNHG